jgi:orotidine-5'-phosphate decarboxylase
MGKLIVALDVETYDEAARLVDELSDRVEIFKVGIAPFTSFGERLLGKISEAGKKVFLDLKFHDIPNTVRAAARAGAEKGVFMMNFHCLGGEKMLRAAKEGAAEGSLSGSAPILLGVTILTSMDDMEMSKIGLAGTVKEKVMELASKAARAGLDGVVASAHEAKELKQARGQGFIIVTPGVRPAWAAKGDQERIMTPARAIEEGADYIVVGRPIIAASDPREATGRILEEIGTKCR